VLLLKTKLQQTHKLKQMLRRKHKQKPKLPLQRKLLPSHKPPLLLTLTKQQQSLKLPLNFSVQMKRISPK
jgi:hypothetical protein